MRTNLLRPCYRTYIYRISKNTIMGVWQQIAEYLYLKKKDPNAPHTSWMKYMHGINRISIFMFLIALIIIVLKIFVFKKH